MRDKVNPVSGERHEYYGREVRNGVTILECEECCIHATLEQAKEDGWKHILHRPAFWMSRETPATRHCYVCPRCREVCVTRAIK